jgi:hypothetical protein
MGGILALFPAVLMTLVGTPIYTEAANCTSISDLERLTAVNKYDPYLSGDDRDGRRITIWVNTEVSSSIITYFDDKSELMCDIAIIHDAHFYDMRGFDHPN